MITIIIIIIIIVIINMLHRRRRLGLIDTVIVIIIIVYARFALDSFIIEAHRGKALGFSAHGEHVHTHVNRTEINQMTYRYRLMPVHVIIKKKNSRLMQFFYPCQSGKKLLLSVFFCLRLLNNPTRSEMHRHEKRNNATCATFLTASTRDDAQVLG